MNRTITSALLAITLTLGCGGAAVAQAPKPARAKVADLWAAIIKADARKDYSTKLSLLRPLAAQGDQEAQVELGVMYLSGYGVLPDQKESARLFGLAAAQGYDRGQYALGKLYLSGQGVVQNYKEAARLLGLSAAQGNSMAQYYLGEMYANGQGVAQNYARAHMWFNIAAATAEGFRKAVNYRDLVAARMTPAQIAEAQAMARKCQASNFKQCD